MIEFKSVSKIYKLEDRDLNALDNINLKINKGEFVVILGQSGSGKSTLLNILSGMDHPSKGSVLFNGNNLAKMKLDELAFYRRSNIGMVFQKFNLINSSNIRDNVILALKFSGSNKENQKKAADKTLGSVGLLQRAKSVPAKLSGGQQQRAAIARALANDPEIIVCDEPTGSLDSQTGREVIEMIKELSRQGKTVVMATHNKDYAFYADRIIEMADGKIISDKAIKQSSVKNAENKSKNGSLSFLDASFIGFKNLMRRKLRFLLTSFGIAIGSASIIVLVSFGAGLQKTNSDLMKDFVQLEEIFVSGTNYDSGITAVNVIDASKEKPLNDKTVSEFKKLSGVKDAYAQANFSAEAALNGKTARFYNSKSSPLEYAQKSVKEKIKYGSYFVSDEENSIVIPYEMAKIFGYSEADQIIGQEAVLQKFGGLSNPDTPVEQKEFKLKIIGVIGEKDKMIGAMLPYKTGLRINNEIFAKEAAKEDSFLYGEIVVRAADPKKVGEIKNKIVEMGYGANSFEDMAKSLGGIFSIMQIVLGVIGSVALAVASLGVINTMLMAILERTKEIGIMKAIGARNKDVRRIFLFESGYIGLFGGIAGVIFGLIASKIVEVIVSFYLQNNGEADLLSFYVPPYLMLFVVLFSIGVSIAAGYIPSRRASRLDPVVALRDE
ncbi:ABC transporter ATP-binding protein/permease [Patescibacteria group bacterium]|nr:MAG: ABC transporter ATP-binding protein/permease [Patescibacteria group bacterium]